MNSKRTYSAKDSDIDRKWFIIDATDQVLGRLATRAARILTGKDKPIYTAHVDCGDHLIILNANKIRVTGKKMKDKIYYRHTGYIGNLKATPLQKMFEEKPEEVIVKAVHGMVPKTRLGRAIMKKLKVYKGADHPHVGQKPITIE